MKDEPQQLPLQIKLRDDATFDNFFVGADNKQLATRLSQLDSDTDSIIYLWGNTGVGRSHLLQAACHAAIVAGQPALYLPLQAVQEYAAHALLEDLEYLQLICLDDIEQVAGKPDWEEALFHLYNRVHHHRSEHSCRLLVSAAMPPRQVPIQLPDLVSRLQWGSVYQLQPLNDLQKQHLLQLRAKQRGLHLSDEVARFIVNRGERHVDALLALLDQLDNASLVHRRRITIPFVKTVLNW